MPVHCLLVLTRAGVVLFTRHYDAAGDEAEAELERQVAEATRRLWVASFEEDQVERTGDKWIVVRGVSDLVLILVGSDDFDALTLSATLGTAIDVLQEACGRKLSEATLVGNYGKVCVSIDEMLGARGQLEWSDVDVISRQGKLKPAQAIKK
uniref:Coatomer subunit zeta n=1 Tax=Bicosoecida sp. CB-2014 TaxID=1486930 RepID=A0A7S1G4F1_9STRA|mmetsp:Transcript_14074/g.49015  ORF Transcript_14074/g.49015 Transcript_14074/m.49015 type:complete len:152 (+) Transcript_14074:180-635(+)